jgi:hypothetical protein
MERVEDTLNESFEEPMVVGDSCVMGYGDRSEMTWTFTVSRSFYVVGQYCCGASYTLLYFALRKHCDE